MHKNAPLSPIPFPVSSRAKGILEGNDNKVEARVQDKEIFELCRETLGALQELRHGIQFALFDMLEKLDLDARVLANLIEARPGATKTLLRKDTERLATERLIEILEKLAKSETDRLRGNNESLPFL
jgi:hypothetical protein